MEFRKIGIKVPIWSIGIIFSDWATFPYWYNGDDKIKFLKKPECTYLQKM
jgi:hypothetical protein